MVSFQSALMSRSFLQENKEIITAQNAEINKRYAVDSFFTTMLKSAFWSNFAFTPAKMRKIIGLCFLLCFFYPAQTQQVTKDFMKLVWEDNFQKLENVWAQQSTADNFFIGSSEGFEVWRKSKNNGYFIFPQKVQEFRVFEVSLQFVFDGKGAAENAAGLLLQAQPDGSGAVIVEVNRKKQFRIRRASSNRLIPVNEPNKGWRKPEIKIRGEGITLTVKTNDKVYDVYINNVYAYSFTEIEFSKGWIGLYVGPETRVIYKKLTVKIDDESSSLPTALTNFPDDRKSLHLQLARLKEVIQKKDFRIAELEGQLKDQTGLNYKADSVLLKQSQEAVARVDELEIELEKVNEDKLKLEKELLKLQQFKNAASGAVDVNVTDNLININEELRIELQKSKKTIEDLEAALLKQQSQVDGWIKKLNQMENATEDFKNNVRFQRGLLIQKDSIIREQQKSIDQLEKSAREAEKDKKKTTLPSKKEKEIKKENLFDEN